MSEKFILALDQGTTSSRAILFNKRGEICATAQKELTQHYPHEGWIEHSPQEIWTSQLSVAVECIAKGGITALDVLAIGITNQRETTVVWDKYTGEPVCNAIVWQCRRTAERVDELKREGFDKIIREKTGLIADAYFSATKIEWILNNVEGVGERAQKGDLLFGTVDSWLIWKLTGGKTHATDHTNASRTMLYNIHTLDWDDELLEKFAIPRSMLPKVLKSSDDYGTAKAELLGHNIPICGVAGDQQSALFGQCCFEKGEVKNTYGTGCFLLMNTGNEAVSSKNGLLTTISATTSDKVEYALEGSVFVAGAAVQWLRDEMKIISTASESCQCARAVENTGGVFIVPAFTGLGAPHWNAYARGTIVGITRGTNRNHIVRATLESLAFQTRDVLVAMETDCGSRICGLRVDGGASANDFLMQFQADILGCEVTRPIVTETTALGATFLAGLHCGFWESKSELRTLSEKSLGEKFLPSLSQKQTTELLKGWQRAVSCAKLWAESFADDSEPTI